MCTPANVGRVLAVVSGLWLTGGTVVIAMPLMGSTAPGPTIIYVDDDNCPGPGDGSIGNPYCSIQTAIDAAVATDEVVVAPGTYFETIDFLGKAVTLRSSDGPEVTTIDAQQNGSVVTCDSVEGPDTVLDGFTITGGVATFGGGMSNDGSSPTVINCTFRENSGFFGGGMASFGSSPTVINSSFEGNTAGSQGGGMYSFSVLSEPTNPVVTGCVFTNNFSSADGTGLICQGDSLLHSEGTKPCDDWHMRLP